MKLKGTKGTMFKGDRSTSNFTTQPRHVKAQNPRQYLNRSRPRACWVASCICLCFMMSYFWNAFWDSMLLVMFSFISLDICEMPIGASYKFNRLLSEYYRFIAHQMQRAIQSVEDIVSRQLELLESNEPGLLKDVIKFLNQYPVSKLKQQRRIASLMKILALVFYLQTQEQLTILSIYQRFVVRLSQNRHSENNNFATMLHNMKAYVLLQEGAETKSIRAALKSVNKYSEEGANCDPCLIALSQNNIAALYLQDEEYQKSFRTALKAYEIMKNYLQVLKKNKDSTIHQKMVIFVNSCYLIRQSLNGRMLLQQPDEEAKKEYLESMQLFYNEGCRNARKYLGTESYLLRLLEKRHTPLPIIDQNFTKDLVWKFELPIFHTTPSDIVRQQVTKVTQYLNQRINPMLDSLLSTILRTQQNRKTITLPPSRPPPPPPPPPEPEPEPEQDLLLDMTKYFPQTKGLTIKIKLYKGKRFKYGKTVIEIFEKQRSVCKQNIQQQLLNSLVRQLYRDCAPYDTHIDGCSPQQFAEYFLLPFIYLESGQLNIQPHCKGLLDQKLITFLGYESYVFVNHIEANEFRISICPLQMSECLHITVVVQESIMEQIVKDYSENYIQDSKIQNLLRVCKGESTMDQDQQKISVFELVFTQLDLLEGEIPSIIQGFQKFMKDHKFVPSKPEMLFKPKKRTYRYFKYKIQEFKTGKGCYYGIRNIDKTKTIDVVLQNRHQTYCPTGKIQAKGYHCLQYSMLYFEFGVEDCSKYEKEEVLQVFVMVSQMYHLYTYEYELEKDQKQLYGENAIRVGKLIGRVGKRICQMSGEYINIITAQVVTVNSQIPLGVKVTMFNEQLCLQNGFFLRLDKRRWLKQRPKDLNTSLKQSKMSSNSNRSSASIFSNRKVKEQPPALLNYLFNPILTTVGFDILIKELQYYENRQYYGLRQTLGNPKFGKLQDFLPLERAREEFELQALKNQRILNSQRVQQQQLSHHQHK